MGSLSRDTSAGGVLRSGTAVTASGTSVDFTGIPSWVKRITVLCSQLSTSGSSPVIVQLGDSGGIETSGYEGSISIGTSVTTFSTSFIVHNNIIASTSAYVYVTITNITGNSWVDLSTAASTVANAMAIGTGGKTLSTTLDRIRITTVNGTDTFDAGTINILYE